MASRRTKIFPKSGRGLGHVIPTILAVRSAILATAWLLVVTRIRQDSHMGTRVHAFVVAPSA